MQRFSNGKEIKINPYLPYKIHISPWKNYTQISSHFCFCLNLQPQAIQMASQILVIVSFLAISCSLAAAGIEPGPLQDFCVADPTSSGGGLIDLLKTTLQLISFNHIQEINYSFILFLAKSSEYSH